MAAGRAVYFVVREALRQYSSGKVGHALEQCGKGIPAEIREWASGHQISVGVMNREHEEQQAATITAAIAWAVGKLRQAGVDDARLTAELLLAHVLGWERARVIGHSHDPMAAGAREEFQTLVGRRAAGEPLQYLTGSREFYGLLFRVTPAVLIPRPETEILVERAVDLSSGRKGAVRFLDVGTGSGCIAVSMAHEAPRALGWATDISYEALALARENASRHGVAGRIGFVCGDLLECFPARPFFDLILSNPPYISDSEMDALPSMVREHEPRPALSGGASGLEAYLRLIPQAGLRLAEDGYLVLEIGAGQADKIAELVERAGLFLTETVKDLQSIPRCLVAQRRNL